MYAVEAVPAPGVASAERDVLYATTRRPTGSGEDAWFSNGESSILYVGTCRAEIPDAPAFMSSLRDSATASKPPRGLRANAQRIDDFGRIILDDSVTARFVDEVNRRLGAGAATPETSEMFVYVHGFQADFSQPITRVAQLETLLGPQHVGIAFCWHSGQSLTGYWRDARSAKASIERLADLLMLLSERTTARRINVIAYSAGAPLASGALDLVAERFDSTGVADARARARIGAVLLLSADIDLEAFGRQQVRRYYKLCDRIVVTISGNDLPLQVASFLSGTVRLGGDWQSRLTPSQLSDIAAADRIDFVDLTRADGKRPGDFAGHYVWFTNSWALSDLILSIREKRPPDQRGLSRSPDGALWYFPHDYPSRLLRSTASQPAATHP